MTFSFTPKRRPAACSRSGRYTGSLYQLVSQRKYADGSYVAVNGPHDTFGVITSSKKQDDGGYLNQIRGVPARTLEKPVAQF